MPSARGLVSEMRQRRRQLERLDLRLQRAVALELKRYLRRRRLHRQAYVGLGNERPELGALAFVDVGHDNPLCFIGHDQPEAVPDYDADLPVARAANPRRRPAIEKDGLLLDKLLGRMGLSWQAEQGGGDVACTIVVRSMGPGQTEVRGHLSPNEPYSENEPGSEYR